MKKLILTATAAAMLVSCGMLKGNSTQATAPAATATSTLNNSMQAGQNAGVALKALYAQYKLDGKFDSTNLTNVANAMSLLSSIADLPSNYKNKEYIKSFGMGLAAASAGLVTPSNQTSVISNLSNLATQYAAGQQAVANASQQQQTQQQTTASGLGSALNSISSIASSANSINTLLSLFK